MNTKVQLRATSMLKIPRSANSLVAFILLLTIVASCKKSYIASETEQSPQMQSINGNQTIEQLEPYRWISPYSIKAVRAIREAAASINDPLVHQRLLGTLHASNYYLYYKIVPDTEARIAALNSWLEADSNRIAVAAPIDSLSMFPSRFSESGLDIRQKDKKVFYTTVAISEPLPTGMGAEVIDTLYKPGNTEIVLDFILNLYTANFSNSFLEVLKNQYKDVYKHVSMVISHESFLVPVTESGIIRATLPGSPAGSPNPHKELMKDMTYGIESESGSGSWSPAVPTGGRITFEETALGINEGIKGLRVTAMRFVIAPYFRTTDNEGRFSSELPSWGFVALIYSFKNSDLKIRSIDYSSGVVSDVLAPIRHIMLFILPETHIRMVDPTGNINNINTHFNHGTKKALWGLTFNAIQEANDYAATSGIYSYSPIDRKFLNVMCYYNNSTTSASAPMLGYIGLGGGVGATNIIFHTLGLSSLMGSTLGGLLPDVIISQSATSPIGSRGLRETVYHEYGHTRHYFKANQFSNAHWLANISKTLAHTGYGDDINESSGNFMALSEGWADFIGHNFAFRRYGAGITFTELNRWTMTTVTGNYNQLLEQVPTYFNNFIPRGLFHDLMDNFNGLEPRDNIQGYTILQIYNRFNDATWTIQKFRERWEDEYPSPNNANLFDWYNIDLP